jgi:glycerol-3-phosphate dehydrogenase
LAAPEKKGQTTKELSRSHKIIVSETGLISITGGKWTTYRKIAEEIVNKAITVHQLPNNKCVTEHLAIHGNKKNSAVDLENHLFIYGTDATAILQLQESEPKLKEKLHPDYNYTLAEVVWAIREEMATTVEDILARRVRLLFLDARVAIACAEKVARLLAKELEHNEEWIQNQLIEFKAVANGFLLKEFRVT